MGSFRKVTAAALALALMLAPTGAFAQGGKYFWFQAVTEDGEPFQEEGVVRCSVYTRDATTTSTIVHTTAQLTAAYTLPLASNTNGIVHWYSSSDAPVNLKCFTQYGDYVYKNNFSVNRHKVVIDTTRPEKIFRFPYVANASPTSTGLVVPMGGMVTGAAVEVVTAIGPAAHINVGFAGNHTVAARNAIISVMAVNRTGYYRAHALSATAEISDFGAANTAGASEVGFALRHAYGGGSAGGADSAAILVPRPYMVHVSSGLEITYDTSAAVGGGHVYVYWTQLHVGANRQPYR